MPKIKRSVDYTFQAYSGVTDEEQKNDNTDTSKLNVNDGSDSDNDSE